ncbi:hypothetical protein [Reichenbachiella versicolor]|uniref:hypothetical protein n=1 Tax=Reichenbachiella versicolor TaxID=1821036 RepID=UPI001C8881C0|nr:hypothetical protein [Reichenbachiella versicolor]
MNNNIINIIIVLLVGFIVFKTCSGGSSNSYEDRSRDRLSEWRKSPIDELIRQLSDEPTYSILLYDMDADESEDIYRHQYRVIIEKPDTVMARETTWYDVSPVEFEQHIDDMGMTIVSKKNGVLHKETSPAGYDNYVGNEKYGQWRRDSGGNSFWEFYGRYAFMSSMFNMIAYPARYSYWNNYYGGYYGTGRSYYGPNNYYGTRSYTSSNTGQKTNWGSRPSSFKQKVRNNVARSAAASSSRSYSSGSSYSKTSRNDSRSSSSTGYRSRSGGFGK